MIPDINVVLLEPEIPQNTGNIARTCAATGAVLHLVRPIGFSLEDRYLKRAGLDYWEFLTIHVHESLAAFLEYSGIHADSPSNNPPFYFFTRKARTLYTEAVYPPGSWIIFGKESTGLPDELISEYSSHCIRIPVREKIRSLNLSNAVAIVVYEAFRVRGFDGLSTVP